MWEGFVTAIVCCWKMLLYFLGLAFGAAFSFIAIFIGLAFVFSLAETINNCSKKGE